MSRILQLSKTSLFFQLPASTLVVLILATGCTSEPSPTSPVGLNSEFQLGISQTVQVTDGLAITFKEVTEDSRCPVDVECVWAGQAVIVLGVTQDGASLGDFSLTLGTPDSDARQVDIPGYRIEALELAPEPRSEGTDPSEYVVTLVVSAE